MKGWYHFLLDKLGRSYYEDDNGNISQSTSPRPLKYTPSGWEDISIGLERDTTKWGLIKKFSFPLKFPVDGRKILNTALLKIGLEAELFYLVTQRAVEFNGGIFKDYHTKWFRGEVKKSTIKIEEDYTECTIGPTDTEKLMSVNYNTVFEFPLSDADAVNIKMDGVRLYSSSLFQAPPDVLFQNSLFNNQHVVPFGPVNTEGPAYGIAVFSQIIESVNGTLPSFLQSSSNYFMAADTAINGDVLVRATGKMILSFSTTGWLGTRNPAFRVTIESNLGSRAGSLAGKQFVFTDLSSGSGSGPRTFGIDTEGIVSPGEHLFLIGNFENSSGIYWEYEFFDDSYITFSYGSLHRTSFVRAFSFATVFKKVIQNCIGKSGKSSSILFDTPPYNNYFLTSGDGIRGLNNAVLKISYEKFFNIARVLCFSGESIDDNIVSIESLLRFFNTSATPPDSPVDLGDAKTISFKIADDLLCNKIDIGHQDKDIDGVNGKYRFNTKNSYSTKRTETDATLSLVSPAIADPYIIEHLRITYDGKKTTDSDKDNEIIFLHGSDSVTSELSAVASILNTKDYNTNSTLLFDEFNNVGVIANSSLSVFSWLASSSIPFTLKFSLLPISLTVPGESVTVTLLINDIPIVSGNVNADGINVIELQLSTLLNTGDNIRFEISNATSGDTRVITATMSIQFTDLPIKTLFRENYDSIEGVPDNTVFNVSVSPSRLFYLWKRYIDSLLYKLDGSFYKFETTERNPLLKTVKAGEVYDEDADIVVGSNILFKPYYFVVETEVPINMIKALYNNPNLPFSFFWLNNQYDGFIMKGGAAPDDNRSQIFTLLCSPETNEENLIN